MVSQSKTPAPEPSTTKMPSAPPAVKGVAKTLAQHHKAVIGFLLGFFLVLLLYTFLSGQLVSSEDAIVRAVTQQSTPAVQTDQDGRTTSPTSPTSTSSNSTQDNLEGKNTERSSQPAVNDEASDKMEEDLIRQDIDQAGTKNGTNHKPGAPRKPICDLSDPRYDICEISGDARTMGTNRTILYVPPVGERGLADDSHEWSIRDQSRKYLEYINKVTVRSLDAQAAPGCTSRHAVPAVVFAMNGLTSNPWHDFSDVLIPLFITTRVYEGEVQFLVSDLQPWFVDKYRLILTNLSRYDIVDFNQDSGVRCYPHITVGLRSHRDLGIDPARTPRSYTMLDFRLYIREVYSLPPAGVDIPFKESSMQRRPRAMLINRGRTRKFVNFQEIAAAVVAAGFEVVPVEPRRDLSIEEFSRVVDSCDVLMGAHGAGLTNFFFLRTNAVMLQVVPWGHMEHPSMVFYGGPAREMRLRDVEYSIAAEESTLYDKYGKDHPAIRDPESIHKQGWQFGMKYYWIEQDIKLNVTRFAPTLQQVLQMLRG
uniref:Glycosyltransferase 61 catalytic domain-containing protein n=1 Tax=Oryza meridionalis TaxID=40149 RepID=A0A0E0E1X7_9ORYZ